jgi:prolipoprotein diacylglyceryl transferase
MPKHARLLSFIPSPSINGFHLGPLYIHFYGLMYVVGITLAIIITRRRWRALGGDPDLVYDVAIWAVPLGLIGARAYSDITTPSVIPPHWWGVFAIWNGGLGIWGGIAAGALTGIWRVRRAGASAGLFANAIAPALLVAQAVGRVGNYFNQELFGKPTTLPWALEISVAHRPAGYLAYSTFQPTFLYELIWDLALAAFLVWLGHHRKIKPWGLFALYVAGYSAFRIFEETVRIDTSEHFLGLRLNFYVATVLTLVGLAWFVRAQRSAMPDTVGAGTGGPAADGPGAAESGADGPGASESGSSESGSSESGSSESGSSESGAAESGASESGEAEPEAAHLAAGDAVGANDAAAHAADK